MQTPLAARTTANNALTGLTYIDSLISGATAQGLFSIMVSPVYLTTTNRATLVSNGYAVTPKYYSADDPSSGNPSSYIISW